VYNFYIGYSVLKHSYESFYKLIDKGFIEMWGPQGFSHIVYKLAVFLSKKQLSYIYHSASLLLLGFVSLIYIILIF